MKKKLNYNQAAEKLEQLVYALEEGDIPLDKLAATVGEAKQYISICDEMLKGIEKEVAQQLKDE